MAVDEAMESGARALFGEKYGEEVRVVSMGEPEGNSAAWSIELCGGTHVSRTGDIGIISIVSEGGVSSGVRRIEALTGRHARQHANHAIALARSAATELRTTLEDMPARIAGLIEERKRLERDLSDAKQKLALSGGGGGSNAPDFILIDGTKLLLIEVKGYDPKNLKPLADQGLLKVGSGVVAVANTASDGKGSIVVGVTPDLVSRYNAVNLVRVGSEALGGKGGGGRPEMAQAGGPDGDKAGAALSAIEKAMAGVA
jgi:alanyl-tRNA synthetase